MRIRSRNGANTFTDKPNIDDDQAARPNPRFFQTHWQEFSAGVISPELVLEAWNVYAGSCASRIPLTLLELMLHQFYMAIPDVDRVLTLDLENALFAMVAKQVQIKMEVLYGEEMDRINHEMSQSEFTQSFEDIFAGADMFHVEDAVSSQRDVSMDQIVALKNKVRTRTQSGLTMGF
eukprot:CRZ04702.1 hypothetical protein [Spongospora subterranea]